VAGLTGAFFRLEGALVPCSAWEGASWLASNAAGLRQRLWGLGGVALGASLGAREPALGRALAWSMLRGLSDDRLSVLGADYARDRLVPKVRDEAKRLLDDARRAGSSTILISESVDSIARPFGEAFGFDQVWCNVLERNARGAATGALVEPRIGGEFDPRRLRELARRHTIDLERSSAYGARNGDAVLLAAVGFPCAIEPDRELARIARDLDWPIVHGRASASRAIVTESAR
jgi:phosphoserine phosphatase